MKCAHCGSEWTVGAESIQKIKNCPFCGKSLLSSTPASGKPESLESSLQQIRDQFGLDPFRNGKALLSLHSDLVPERQRDRRLIGHFVVCGGHTFLEDALKKPKAEQSAALVRLVKRMYEDWMIREDAARQICAAWWQILGGDPECLKGIAQSVAVAPETVQQVAFSPKTNAVCRKEDFRIEGETLKEYTGKDAVIRVPDGIATIGRSAFARCGELKSVTIPEGVHTVDMQAFLGCSNLEEVRFPDGLKTIGYAAFRDCTSLKSVTLPEGLKHLDDYAFKNCSALQSIVLPDSLDVVSYEVFQECVSLQSVTLPKGMKTIVGCAFWGCTALRKIVLPEDLRALGDYAFAKCKALEEIRIPGTLSKIPGNAFLSCEGLKRVEICQGVTSIGVDAFDGCTALKTLVIPDSITSIHPNAFKKCSGIQIQASQSWKKAHPDLLANIPQ